MSKFIFNDMNQFRACMCAALRNLWWGLSRVFIYLFYGILSILIYAGKQIEAFCKREPIASFIMAVLIVTLSFGWISTFVSGRIATRTAQYQRDSVSIKLDRYLQCYDSTAIIIIENDTIR
jgi:hypothetical protein